MAKAKYAYNPKTKDWRAKRWDGTYNPDGSKHMKNIRSTKSSADLEKLIREFERSLEEGRAVEFYGRSFVDYAWHWLAVAKSAKEKNTQAMYRNAIRAHLSFLSDVGLQDIRHSHFQQAINNQLGHPRTCRIIQQTFTQIIRMAVQDRLLPKSAVEDICTSISLPKYIKPEKRALTPVEKAALRAVSLDDRKAAFLNILYYCGGARPWR